LIQNPDLASLAKVCKLIVGGLNTATMNISLPESMKEFIESQSATKGFRTVSEYVRSIIREVQERQAEREKVDAFLLEALDSGTAVPFAKPIGTTSETRSTGDMPSAQVRRMGRKMPVVVRRPTAIVDIIVLALMSKESSMTTKLSDELRLALEQPGGIPVHLVDSTTNEGYVIMRADQYEKVKVVFEREDHDFDPREAYPFVDEAMQADDANDPTLETYQSFPRQES
jgi:antitoxin ParD1/3/4